MDRASISDGLLTILDATTGFLARANRKGLLGRIRTNFDGIDVNTAGNAWLEAVLVMWVYNLLAWACAEDDVVGLDLLYSSSQIFHVRSLEKVQPTQLMIG